MNKTPFTFVAIVVLAASIYGVWAGSAKSKDVSDLSIRFTAMQLEFGGMQFTLKHDHLDSRAHSTETELFNLQQKVRDDLKKGKPADAFYQNRIDELGCEHYDLRHQTWEMDHPKETEPPGMKAECSSWR